MYIVISFYTYECILCTWGRRPDTEINYIIIIILTVKKFLYMYKYCNYIKLNTFSWMCDYVILNKQHNDVHTNFKIGAPPNKIRNFRDPPLQQTTNYRVVWCRCPYSGHSACQNSSGIYTHIKCREECKCMSTTHVNFKMSSCTMSQNKL